MEMFYTRKLPKFNKSKTSYKIVQKDDGLPQIVCLRCLGTLEFLCDFYDHCHTTQKELSSNIDNIREEMNTFHVENAESNKENAFPLLRKSYRLNDSKRRLNDTLDGSNLRTIENLDNLVTIDVLNTNEGKNVKDKKDCIKEFKSDKNLCTNKDTYLKTNIKSSLHLKNKRNGLSGIYKNNNTLISETADSRNIVYHKKATILRKTRDKSHALHSSVIKKVERKNKCNKALIDSTNAIKKGIKNSKTDYSQVIPFHNNRNITKTETLTLFNHVDFPQISDVINNHSTVCPNKVEKSFITKTSVLLDATEDIDTKVDNGNVEVEEKDIVSTKLKCDLGQNKIIVLKENSLNVVPHTIQALQSNQFVWIPNNELLQEPRKPKYEKHEILSNTSPQPGDEAGPDQQVDENSVVNRINNTSTSNSNCIKKECFKEQIPAKIYEPSGETVESEKRIEKPTVATQLTQQKEQISGNENCAVEKSDFKDNLSKQKANEGGFGKISELISQEQKLEIEKYYKVDMSVVDSKAVLKNLTVIDKKHIQCNICGTLYPRMDKCQVHVWGHLNMRPYKCTACEFSTVTVSNVRCHIRKSHLKIKPFACHLCEKRYVTAVLLQEHLNTHTGARPFKCKICDFASSSRQVLSYHNTTHKPVKDIHCKVCGKEFYSRGRMRAHMLIHNKDKVVMCKICSAYLSNTTALEQHMKNIHTRDYICNVCGKNLKSRKTLLNHKNVHAAAKYKCDLCPNVYKSSHILKEHLLKHEGIRKYKCNICEKSFAQQSHLAAHMAVHSEVRYHCPGCNKAFNRQDNMKIHTKRCDIFLSNPELKNILKNKEKVRYVKKNIKPASTDTHSNTKNSSSNKLTLKSAEENSSDIISVFKDVVEQGYYISQEDLSQCEPNTSVQNDETIGSPEKMITLNSVSSNDVCVNVHENSTVIENVLSSDRF